MEAEISAKCNTSKNIRKWLTEVPQSDWLNLQLHDATFLTFSDSFLLTIGYFESFKAMTDGSTLQVSTES